MMVTATGMANGMVWMVGNKRRANCHRTPISMNEKVGTIDSHNNITDTPMANATALLSNPVKRKTMRYWRMNIPYRNKEIKRTLVSRLAGVADSNKRCPA